MLLIHFICARPIFITNSNILSELKNLLSHKHNTCAGLWPKGICHNSGKEQTVLNVFGL